MAVTASLWPFGLLDWGQPDIRTPEVDSDAVIATPVLLVHGFSANKSNWFFLRRDLRAAGFGHVHAVNYNPFVNDIPTIAASCVRRARLLMEATGSDRVHLVGHSLGGLIARYAVQLGGLSQAATCVTVASPHQGLAPARLAAWPASLCQVRPDADVLVRLRASSRRLPTRFVAYYSNLDVLVPGRRAMILEPALGATNVLVRDEGHLSILISRRFSTMLVQELKASEGTDGYGASLQSVDPAA